MARRPARHLVFFESVGDERALLRILRTKQQVRKRRPPAPSSSRMDPMTLSLSKITRSFLAVGIVAPCLLQALYLFKIVRLEIIPEWVLIALWPGFGFYMAADTGKGPDSGGAVIGFFLSVLANALVYLPLGGLVSLTYRRLLQPESARKGNHRS